MKYVLFILVLLSAATGHATRYPVKVMCTGSVSLASFPEDLAVSLAASDYNRIDWDELRAPVGQNVALLTTLVSRTGKERTIAVALSTKWQTDGIRVSDYQGLALQFTVCQVDMNFYRSLLCKGNVGRKYIQRYGLNSSRAIPELFKEQVSIETCK